MQPSFVARFIRYAERMEQYGPDLGMPHTRAMGDGVFEMRLSGPDGIARVFYTVKGRRIVMLHHFVKKSRKTPPKELAVARRRQAEVR
jgi:phage-related protein